MSSTHTFYSYISHIHYYHKRWEGVAGYKFVFQIGVPPRAKCVSFTAYYSRLFDERELGWWCPSHRPPTEPSGSASDTSISYSTFDLH
jgi:hypothetical protein